MREYLVLQHLENRRAWSVAGVDGPIPDDFRLAQGVRLQPDYPDRVVLPLDPRAGNMRVDFIRNLDRLIIASPRAVEAMRKAGVSEKDVELLPVLLQDKKGRVLPEPHTIVNPIRKVDCLDRKRSGFENYPDSDEVMGIGKLFVVPKAVPEKLVLFRLGERPEFILVRSDLCEAIEAAQLTGFRAVAQGEPLV